MNKKLTILIPAMLDFHFPLLKYAFQSKHYQPVILEEENVAHMGLKYLHNDLCYPVILITGQFITALKSKKYGENIALMIPQAGDACRGSNYIFMIKKALKSAGFGDIPVISLNFKGLEKNNRLKINLGMIRRGLASVMYGDILMILQNQLSAYEMIPGEAAAKAEKWMGILRKGIIDGSLLSASAIKKTFSDISDDFALISLKKRLKPIIGIVGELYVKYCHLGNGNICDFLNKEGCGAYINGFSWYILYYLDTHLASGNSVIGIGYKSIMAYLEGLQRSMVDSLRKNNFFCCDPFTEFKKNSEKYVSFECNIADGWLISAEIVNIHKNITNKIACVQPFGCMPNHVFGKGFYSHLQRSLNDIMLSSIDFDSGSADINLKNRLSMLIQNTVK